MVNRSSLAGTGKIKDSALPLRGGFNLYLCLPKPRSGFV
jgi:hypothetical protein